MFVPSTGALGFGTAGVNAFVLSSFVAQVGSDYGMRAHFDASNVAFDEEEGPNLGWGSNIQSTLVSYDPDGFTVAMSANGTWFFHWMAFGGDDLEAYVGTFPVLAGSTSSIPVTGVGFTPDFLFCQTGIDPNGIAASVSYGMASSPSEQASMSGARGIFGYNTANLLDNYLLCPKQHAPGGAFESVDYLAQLASFDVDGFTVDIPVNTGLGGNTAHFLALRDPTSSFAVGTETMPTGTGNQSTAGLGFQPGGGIFLGSNQLSDSDTATYPGPPVWSIGFADAVGNQGVNSEFNRIGGLGSTQNSYSSDTSLLAVAEPSTTLLAEASLDSWDAGGFTLDFTTATTAMFFIYGVFHTVPSDPCQDFMPIIYRWLKR